jgi:hypothetical protein
MRLPCYYPAFAMGKKEREGSLRATLSNFLTIGKISIENIYKNP